MTRPIVVALVGCVIASAVGGFGSPLLCPNAADKSCSERWQSAASGALTAAGTLGTLLAKLSGDHQPERPVVAEDEIPQELQPDTGSGDSDQYRVLAKLAALHCLQFAPGYRHRP